MFEIKVDDNYVHISIKRATFIRVIKDILKKLNEVRDEPNRMDIETSKSL